MTDANETPRLFLVTPSRVDADALAAALGAGGVAAVLIGSDGATVGVQTLVATVQASGAAALIADDTRLAGHVKADGVHVSGSIADLKLAVESFRPKRIVGAGNIHSRHAAMQAGELGVDYVFFGRPQGDTHAEAHPKALELAEWWSEIAEVPAVVMAGRSIESVAAAAATGAEFVALHDAVWAHPGGPAESIREASAILAGEARRAA